MLTIAIHPLGSVIVQETDEFVTRPAADQSDVNLKPSKPGQPTLSMSVRGCPNGKSIPAIQGPGSSSSRLNRSNDAKRSTRDTVRRSKSTVPYAHVMAFALDGRLVKSTPRTSMIEPSMSGC